MTVRAKYATCDAEHVCHWLEDRTSPHRAKGFASVVTLNLDSGETKWQGVAYHTGAKDSGLMLAYCPFCGGRPGPAAQQEPT